MTGNLLSITDLTVDAPTKASTKRLLNGVSLAIAAGEALALVGESGSGKSLTTRSIMRLLPAHFRVGGSIGYDGRDVLAMNREQLREFRGRQVGIAQRVAGQPAARVGQMADEIEMAAHRLHAAADGVDVGPADTRPQRRAAIARMHFLHQQRLGHFGLKGDEEPVIEPPRLAPPRRIGGP